MPSTGQANQTTDQILENPPPDDISFSVQELAILRRDSMSIVNSSQQQIDNSILNILNDLDDKRPA